MSSQSDFVARRSDRSKEERVVLFKRCKGYKNEELEKFYVFLMARNCKQVLDFSICVNVPQRPVGMLTAAIDFHEGLFMKKDGISVPFKNLLHDVHSDKVLIDSLSGFTVDGAELELVVSHFIVLCLERNTDLQELLF